MDVEPISMVRPIGFLPESQETLLTAYLLKYPD